MHCQFLCRANHEDDKMRLLKILEDTKRRGPYTPSSVEASATAIINEFDANHAIALLQTMTIPYTRRNHVSYERVFAFSSGSNVWVFGWFQR